MGINVIFYYSSVLWGVGRLWRDQGAVHVSMITGGINIGTTLVATALIDRWGRRPLLLFGSAGMAVTLATMAWCFGSSSVAPDGA